MEQPDTVQQQEQRQESCPDCGHLLAILPSPATQIICICATHGRFWFDENGQLHKDRRSPNRPA